jgi:hypothetical protein
VSGSGDKSRAELIAHEEAHATVARWVGWTVTEVGVSKRGGSGFARYIAPAFDLGGWRELYVTLAGPVSDTRTYLTPEYDDGAREVVVRQIARKAKRHMRSGFVPKRDSDEWKAARILVGMHADSLDEIERELQDAWDEVASILYEPRVLFVRDDGEEES